MPNFSVLDGWWSEGYDGTNGWAIGAEREYANEAAQDEADALSLYATLEDEIIPLFYACGDARRLPTGWLRVMRASIATVAPDFSFDRMLKEYVAKFYLPAGGCGAGKSARIGLPRARALAAWEARVLAGWSQVCDHRDRPGPGRDDGGQAARRCRPPCDPVPLAPDDLAVELVYRPRGRMATCARRGRCPCATSRAGTASDDYVGVAAMSPESGAFAYGVRVPARITPICRTHCALGLVKWA